MLHIVLCDKNTEDMSQLEYTIKEILNGKVIISKHNNPFSLMTYVIDDAKGNVDALYINVDMGKKQNGIEIAKHVLEEVPNIKVIFTSSLLKDAVDIFTIDPVYFLVKPYSSDYVRDSIYKLMNIIQEEQTDLITIKSAENKGRLVTIKTRDIYYIESELRVAHIYTIDNLYTTYMTLDEIQNKLKNNFLRCHRSFIVNSDKIKKFIKQGFILFNDKFVPISRSKSKEITQALNDFTEMYSNVEINYEAIPKEEYSERLKAAAEENNLPDLFESTGIDEAVLSNAETLGNVISEVDTDKLYFLNNYEEYYKSEKQIPTSFVMPVVFINTTKAEFDGDFLKDINEIVSDDKEITYSIDDDWIEYYNDKVDFGKYREIEDGKEAFVSGQSAIYFGSSKDIEGIYETMTGKCKHITLEGDEVQCRAGCDWSISGISGKDEIKVAERLLAYLIEDPTAQDYLYMQGDLGDKTKLPVNKGAIETLIGDDAQFYKNILSEIDNFGYKGE